MDRIFICSPLRGDIDGNMRNARQFARFAALQKKIPITPHIYFTQFLNEHLEEERALGISMGIELMEHCDELWVFGTTISEGMQCEINWWIDSGRPLRHFSVSHYNGEMVINERIAA